MLSDLVHAVRQYTDAQAGESLYVTAIDGMTILRYNQQRRPTHILFRPALCITVQGTKWASFGGRHYEYKAGQALVVSVEMPGFGTVVEASPSEPFLGVILQLDLGILREVMAQLDTPPRPSTAVSHSVFVTDFDGPLAECAHRMVRLLDTPSAIPVLYPAIMREICYWLLTGPHAREIVRMTFSSSHARRILHAIHALRDRFDQTVRMEDLAAIAQLSPSAFHRQFKAITSLTPLQYQKQLRLLEARRLMIADAANVETAAFQVGYESPSQFSREYSRMFGNSPRKDIASLHNLAA